MGIVMSSAAAAEDDNDKIMRKILSSTKTIALVGASNKPQRPSYRVMKYLLDFGYAVIPVNPGLDGQTIHGQTVYGNLKSIPQDVLGGDGIDMVDIFRNSALVEPIVNDAIDIHAKSIWMQIGVVNEDAAQKAKDAGLDVVMNVCPAIEIPKLSIEPPASTSKL